MPTKTKKAPRRAVELEPLYTYAEVAEVLDVSVRQVVRYVADGYLGHTQLPRGRRVPRAALLRFIEARTVEAE